MGGSCRPSSLLVWWSLLFFPLCAIAAPAPGGPIIHTNPSTGNLSVFDPTTLNPIPQSPATDGGQGRAAQILWIMFGIAVGGPFGIVGVRCGRLAVGAALGLVGVVCLWAAFVNALPTSLSDTVATADLILTLILLGSFSFLTFLGAYLSTAHPLCLALLGASAGTSFFMRIVIIKGGLLISIYPLNLVLLGLGAVLGGLSVLWKRRLAVIVSSSLISTFLVGLSVDTILNLDAPQSQGMGKGLRYLMDHNVAHIVDITGTGYKPTLKTQLIITVSIALVPILAYIQHRMFGGPFTFMLRRTQLETETQTVQEVDSEKRDHSVSGPIFRGFGPDGSRFSV